MVEDRQRGGVVLSSQEQQIWDEVQRFWAEEVEEPPRAAPSRTKGASRDQADLPVAVIVGTRITIVLVLFGAMVAALTIGVATALGWALWHNWPQLSSQGVPGTSSNGGKDRTTCGPADEPGHRRLRRIWDATS
jgi:hypothetical protein